MTFAVKKALRIQSQKVLLYEVWCGMWCGVCVVDQAYSVEYISVSGGAILFTV